MHDSDATKRPSRDRSADPTPLRLRRLDGGELQLVDGRCALMAVLNVTPDSFSDGGKYTDPARAAARAHELVAQGAAILDVGAESTRPGAELLSAEAEWARLEPVLAALHRDPPAAALSIDTRHAATARRAADVGTAVLNLTFPQHLFAPPASDMPQLSPSECRALLGAFDATVVMHSRGLPATMRQLSEYGPDLCQTVVSELASTVQTLTADDPALRERLIFDPGLGFAKASDQSLALLGAVPRLKALLGGRVLIGASRKSLLGAATGLAVEDRLIPSVVAAALAAFQGADVVRVHDVAATRAALDLAHAVLAQRAGEAP
jgi:dihydropteroate synthase